MQFGQRELAVFRGINSVNVDPKGRLAMPTRYRERLQEESNAQVVATIDTEESCLLLYPLSDWEAIEAKLAKLPSFNPAARRIQRLLMGHATELDMDGQGRVLIPSLLRDYAKIEKTAILLGQGNKFELWSEDLWHKRRQTWIDEGNGEFGLPEELASLSL
jgi:MraZ protein